MKIKFLSNIVATLGREEKSILIVLILSIVLATFNPWIPVIGALYINFAYIRKIRLTAGLFFLLMTWLIYDFLGLSNGNTSIQMAIYLTLPSILFYNMGSRFVESYPSTKSILLIMLVIIASLALPHIIVTMQDIYRVGLINPNRFLSILDADNQRSITQRTIEISLCIGSIGLVFKKEKDNEVSRLYRMYIIFAILAFLCSLHYVSRTGVAICLFSISVAVLYIWKLSFKSILFVIAALIAYSWIQSTELFEVYSARETDYSNIGNAGLRLPRWEWAWNTTFEHPLGTRNFLNAEHPYAHNFWLDIGKNCGVIPFFMMIWFSLSHLKNVYTVIRKKSSAIAFPIMLWAITSYMSLFTEPIHEGATLYMFIYFFICGLTANIADCNR